MTKIRFRCDHTYSSDFSLDLEFETASRCVALFGPSGSGKSSILSMLVGFVSPNQGEITLADRVIFDSSTKTNVRIEKRCIGLVSQDHLVFPHMNVRANLMYGVERKNRTNQGFHAAFFDRVCGVLELKSLLERFPRQLSGGESQRVAIGRALMSQPEILLMDEPFASLDEELQNQIISYLEQITTELQTPIVFVSHNQAHVRRLAEWVVVIENGKKISEGPPEQALSHQRAMTWKRSMGPVNMLMAQNVRKENGRTIGEIEDQVLHLPDFQSQNETAFLHFYPRDVTVSIGEAVGLSSRNQLQGNIRQIVEVGKAIFLQIDIGQNIWAEVTPQSVTELGLKDGKNVTCLIKAQSLTCLG